MHKQVLNRKHRFVVMATYKFTCNILRLKLSHPWRPRGSPGASIRLTVWKLSGESRYPGALLPVLENFRRAFSPGPTDRPWVSEEVECYKVTLHCSHCYLV